MLEDELLKWRFRRGSREALATPFTRVEIRDAD